MPACLRGGDHVGQACLIDSSVAGSNFTFISFGKISWNGSR
jgi:hypothetical protein